MELLEDANLTEMLQQHVKLIELSLSPENALSQQVSQHSLTTASREPLSITPQSGGYNRN